MDFEIGRPVEKEGAFSSWVILELLGHRRICGFMTEAEIAGAKFLRIDIYPEGAMIADATQFYSPSSVYAITPTTEKTARKLANTREIGPVQPWEVAQLSEHEDDRY